MNNVEALDDFLDLLKEVHPKVQIDEREKLMLGMAINHAFLIKREEIEHLKFVMRKYHKYANQDFAKKYGIEL